MSKPYVLLQKQSQTPLPVEVLELPPHLDELKSKLLKFKEKDAPLALDYETQGLNANSDQLAVGIGLSDGVYSLYIPLYINSESSISQEARKLLYDFLSTRNLVGFNVAFDGRWFLKESGKHGNWIMCTYAMFKHLASEGFFLQTWSLKTAMTDILGWPETNTDELYVWLKENKLSKADMWKAPTSILGKYCALDSLATFQLYEYFESFYTKFPDLKEYHTKYMLNLIRLIIDQNKIGINIDRIKLFQYRSELKLKLDTLSREFFSIPKVAEAVELFNQWKYVAWWDKQPSKLNSDNKTISKRWEYWKNQESEVTGINHFNLLSKKHLLWLFYENLFEAVITVNPTRYKNGIGEVNIYGKKVTVELTDGGKFPVDKNILPFLGEAGEILNNYNELATELRYVDACLEVSTSGTLHPNFKCPGTITGRLSGGIEA